MNKLVKLDAIRGFAAIYVVVGHIFLEGFGYNNAFTYLLKFGQEAVILFFLLSGFVIQYAYHYSTDKTFKTYFRKRFIRIYVPLLLIYLANYIVRCIEFRTAYPVGLSQFIGNLFMLQDTVFVKTNVLFPPLMGNLPLWSLSYEWWFYMIFFLIKKYVPKRSADVVYLLSILAAISYIIYPNFVNRIFLYLLIWWAGVDLAVLYINRAAITPIALRKLFGTLALCIVLLGVNAFVNYEYISNQLGGKGGVGKSPILELRNFAFTVVAILFAIVWHKKQWVFFDKTIGLFAPLASISFSLYISHWFLIIKAQYLDRIIPNFSFRYVLYLLVCLLFAFVTERIIYVRINKYLNTRTKKTTVSVPSVHA